MQQIETKEVHKPSVIFLLGGPGSGKGTQSDIMVEKYHFIHYSTGDLLRQFIKTDCEEAENIRKLLRQGKLAPSTMLVEIVKKNIFKNGANNNIYLIDGFPRSAENYQAWTEVMKDDVDVKMMLYLDCSQQILEKRLLQRGKTGQRQDDNKETILKRFQTFKKLTAPFLQFYIQKVGKVCQIQAEKSIQEVSQDINKVLHEHNILI